MQQGDADSGAPVEHVSFGFRKVKVDYRPQKADGSLGAAVTFAYDVAASKMSNVASGRSSRGRGYRLAGTPRW